MVINNPYLIDQKDEVDGYKEAIQTEWLQFYSIRKSRYRNGVKHGEILKQQADHIKLLGLWLEGDWLASSKMGSTQPGRQAVDSLWSQFREQVVSSGAVAGSHSHSWSQVSCSH